MKKLFKSLALVAVAAMTLTACNKEVEPQQKTADGLYKYSFSIIEDKALIGDSNIEWVAGDQVGMFVGDYKGYAKIDVTTSPKMVVLYSNQAIPAGTMAYAYAPYDPANKTADPDLAKIVVADVQSGAGVSAMPLAGIPFEVEEEVAAGNQEGNGAIKFLNLGSVINFKIFSTDEELRSETIQSIKFEATKTIAGAGYVDLTVIDPEDASSLELTFMDEADELKVVRVDQELAVAEDKEDATPIKMVVLPGTFEGTLTVVTDAATYTKEMPEREYVRSGSRTWGLDLAKAEREEGVEETVVNLPYAETFASNLGDFVIKNVSLAEGLSYVWNHDANGYMKATAYISSTNYAAESWLISPWIDLDGVIGAGVSFDHVSRYGTNATDFTLWALTNEEGADWEQLTIPTYSSGSNWTFVNSGEISLNEYLGKQVKIAFKYLSTSTKAGTWEVKNFDAHIVKVDPQLSYESETWDIEIGDETAAAQELTNPNELTVTYASSDNNIVSVNENTGEIETLGETAGTAIITASFAGNDTYSAATASYTINLIDPSVADATYFYETFDSCNGTGGNDGQFSGSIASSDIHTDEDWTSTTACYGADQCAKFGTGSASGILSATVSGIEASAVKISFRAAGWASGTNTLSVSSSTSGVTLSGDINLTLKNSTWTEYIVYVNGVSDSFEFTFTGKRGFIDDVAVYTGDAPVAPVVLQDPEISFATTSFAVEPGSAFTAPELTNPHEVPVTYSSDNSSVASVTSSGVVTIGSVEGTAVITASFAGNETYQAATASYTIVVSSASEPVSVTFTAGVDTGETSVTKDDITVSMSTMSRTDNYRTYANTSMTVTATGGKTIKEIVITCTGSGNANYGPGKFSATGYTYDEYVGTWEGSSTSVSLAASAQVRITEIVVTYQ